MLSEARPVRAFFILDRSCLNSCDQRFGYRRINVFMCDAYKSTLLATVAPVSVQRTGVHDTVHQFATNLIGRQQKAGRLHSRQGLCKAFWISLWITQAESLT
ncbi:hypothetical protein SHM7688_02844 [Shimia marina]|uniref:Uncharacterized protein n=1 Tax=Shimia marina TaxID=321267 RepID=A0A0P1FDJ5_9RHOB|nr:hypothetical protein SHM7688_02844 [Shimia marina]